MVDTIMLFISQVNQTAVTTPGVGMNNAIRLYSAADNGLQGLSGTVRQDLCVDLHVEGYQIQVFYHRRHGHASPLYA